MLDYNRLSQCTLPCATILKKINQMSLPEAPSFPMQRSPLMQAFHGTFLHQEGADNGLFTYLPVLELCGFSLNKLNWLFRVMLSAS